MTDGIIQKIFAKHHHIEDANETHCSECRKLDRIKQELIEEIIKEVKSDLPSYISDIRLSANYNFMLRLIGDNQE